jgi:hypothetical protein
VNTWRLSSFLHYCTVLSYCACSVTTQKLQLHISPPAMATFSQQTTPQAGVKDRFDLVPYANLENLEAGVAEGLTFKLTVLDLSCTANAL